MADAPAPRTAALNAFADDATLLGLAQKYHTPLYVFDSTLR